MLELKDIFQNSGDIADNVFSEMIKECLEKSGSNTIDSIHKNTIDFKTFYTMMHQLLDNPEDSEIDDMLSKHSLSSYKKDIKLLSPEKIKDESIHEEIAKNL